MMVLNRFLTVYVVNQLQDNSRLKETMVLVGASDQAYKIIHHMQQTMPPEIDLIGIFDDRYDRVPEDIEGCKVLGSTDDLISYVRANQIDRIVITLPWSAEERIIFLLRKLRTVPVRIDLCPSGVIWNSSAADVQRVGGIPLVTVANARIGKDTRLVKWIEDITLALILLVFLTPILLIIGLLVRLDSPGPALFRQHRFGFNNEVFTVYKFRSMRTDQPKDTNVVQATRNDPRVTRLGRFLRRSSLDELPQILNVLKGQMSIVGPRPHAVPHNIMYGDIIDEYFARHNVKPGITGWAQVNGFRGETDTEEKMRKRVECDLYYVDNWSLMLDLKIILLTVARIWFQDSAY